MAGEVGLDPYKLPALELNVSIFILAIPSNREMPCSSRYKEYITTQANTFATLRTIQMRNMKIC